MTKAPMSSRSSTSASPSAGRASRAGAARTPRIARCSATCAPPRAAGSTRGRDRICCGAARRSPNCAGWRDTFASVYGVQLGGLIGGTGGRFVGAGREGKLHWWTARGAPDGELELGIGHLVALERLPEDGMIAVGTTGVARVDAQRAV